MPPEEGSPWPLGGTRDKKRPNSENCLKTKRESTKSDGVLVGGGGFGRGDFHAGLGDEVAEGGFAAGAALFVGDVTVFINHDINGIDRGFVHGGEIGRSEERRVGKEGR